MELNQSFPRAFLPEALSEISGYFKSCASTTIEAWQRASDENDRCKTPLESGIPDLPESYKETFSRCIELSEPDVAEHLAYILMRLQIHHARMMDLDGCFHEDRNVLVVPQNIISYMYRLGELQVLTNNLFEFARGLEEFDTSSIKWNAFNNAYINLDIHPEEYGDLVEFTQRALERKASG